MCKKLLYAKKTTLKKPVIIQKQQPEVFYRKNCSEEFRNLHRKTSVMESLFNFNNVVEFFKNICERRVCLG